jgi:DNA recombination protein RmuC
MDSALVVVGLTSLAAGLGIGLSLRKAGAERAAAAARLEVGRDLAVVAEQLRARGEALAEARRAAAESARSLEGARQAAGATAERLAGAQAELEAERRAAVERRAEAERAREQVRAEVETLAGRLLERQGKALLDRSREGLEALLGPLGQKLAEFERKVERAYDADVRERASLREQLRGLQDAQASLHRDAEALSRALTRDSRQQGDWGEIVLERVLEAAGLSRGREYDLQVSHVDDEGGRKRPDALVYLPENRAVVVDAKCSLTAFVDAARASTDEAREEALDAHVTSVRAHVKALAGKSYAEVLQQRSLDFVVMFAPSEAAFLAALSRESALYEDAFRQGVVICSPTTLIAALRLVAQLWRTESQNQNARRIADEAGKLLEKLAAFAGDLEGAKDRLDQAQDALGAALSKLGTGRGNVLRRAAIIAALGAPVRTEKVRALLAGAEGEPEGEDSGAGEAVAAAPQAGGGGPPR